MGMSERGNLEVTDVEWTFDAYRGIHSPEILLGYRCCGHLYMFRATSMRSWTPAELYSTFD